MQLNLFAPESNWSPPECLPDLANARYIGVDTETNDPGLTTRGPGGLRRDGHVAGISLATEIGHKLYLPIGHQAGGNLDKGYVKRYLKAQLSRPRQEKVFANALYDLEMLKCYLDVDVAGPLHDVQIAEPLLDENQRSYSLNRIATKYLGHGKNEELLTVALRTFFGKAGGKKDLWKLHSKYVGPYAEDDAAEALEIFLKQRDLLAAEDLLEIYDLESRLIRVLLDMRLEGVPVDIARAERARAELQSRERETQKRLNAMAGCAVNVWASNSLQIAFDNCGVQYPRLLTGNPSFTADWLKVQEHALPKLVLEARKLNRMWSTFVEGQVLNEHVRGRVHCQFHASRSDDGGTVTGRFSSSNPNLQQVPSPEKDKQLAVFARSLFIPEVDCDWHCNDFSQIEPRLQLHYAIVRGHQGAAEAAKIMIEQGLDFHQVTADITGLTRKEAKTINLGLSYGMGLAKLASQLNISEAEAREVLAQYHVKMPFLKGITSEVTARADQQGFIRTLLGRKRRFDSWEPAGRDRRGHALPSRQAAIEAYGNPVRRAFTHKSFNALIQGSAADVIKKVMIDVYESGILGQGARLHLTVHDELDFSVPKGRADLSRDLVKIMEESCKITVPFKVDNEVGPSWGEVAKLAA